MKTSTELRKDTISYIKDGIAYVCKNFKTVPPAPSRRKKHRSISRRNWQTMRTK